MLASKLDANKALGLGGVNSDSGGLDTDIPFTTQTLYGHNVPVYTSSKHTIYPNVAVLSMLAANYSHVYI